MTKAPAALTRSEAMSPTQWSCAMHEEISTEEWRPVPGWEGLYEASSHGRIRSLPRRTPFRSGCGHQTVPGRVMAPKPGDRGYVGVALQHAGRVKHRRVHALVLESFTGPCPVGMECCHDDGNPSNNRLTNLSWGTPKRNSDDKQRHDTQARGEGMGTAKLTDSSVRAIRRRHAAGETMQALADEHGVSRSAVSYAVRRVTWAHISDEGASLVFLGSDGVTL